MTLVSALSRGLSDLYLQVDKCFREMTSNCKKLAIPVSLNSLEEDSDDNKKFNAFVHLSIDFLNKVRELQAFVSRKHVEFETFCENKVEKLVISKDPDGFSGSSKPRWLEVLLQHYNNECDKSNDLPLPIPPPGDNLPVTKKPNNLFTVGKFCKHIAVLMVLHTNNLLQQEDVKEALNILLDASMDNVSLFNSAAPVIQLDHSDIHKKTQNYYAQRFFNFISTLSEMKSTPKDEKSLLIQ